MTEQEKQLLLKDLCARLPYGVIVQEIFQDIQRDVPVWDCGPHYIKDHPEKVKPYLRAMSSMTKEEKEELKDIIYFGYSSDDYDKYGHRGVEIASLEYDNWERIEFDFVDYCELENWLNEHHFDYRGMIEKGLALPAKENMYND